jgi:cation diffusion facilitator CzcD-associated flavoprotein CzcO
MDTAASVIIVGAGAAGLASAASLRHVGITSVALEASDDVATTWRSLYDRLHLHTVRGLSSLPGLPMSHAYPTYLSREQVVAYLREYARHNAVDVRPGQRAISVRRADGVWVVTTSGDEFAAPALIAATGVFANPAQVSFPGQAEFAGVVALAATYKNPDAYQGKRVLLVGAGNTGAEIAVDLAEAGVATTMAIRAGANVVPRELLGVGVQRWAHLMAALPQALTRPLSRAMLASATRRQVRAGLPRPAHGIFDHPGVPIIGLRLLELARAGVVQVRPGVTTFTRDSVSFADGRAEPFDVVLLATGYRPALGWLGDLITRDADGFPLRDGVRSTDHPDLYYVGMNYSILGTLYNISREAPAAAALIAAARAQR